MSNKYNVDCDIFIYILKMSKVGGGVSDIINVL